MIEKILGKTIKIVSFLTKNDRNTKTIEFLYICLS